MRPTYLLALLLAATLAGAAPAERQVDWVGDWEAAFKAARASDKPVMICINSKDGEAANERTAKTVYRDPAFVTLSRKFVMVVLSVRSHTLSGVCPRFGKVTCQQHLDCWKELRSRHGDTFRVSALSADMISPQHAWFRPDGTLLWRLEFETRPASGFRDELMKRMRRALEAVAAKTEAPESGTPAEAEADTPTDEPTLTPQLKAELERAQSDSREDRRAALANLLAAENLAATEAVVTLLVETKKDEIRCDVLRAIGKAGIRDARMHVEDALKSRNELVRSFAAVCLEDLGDPEAIPVLLKRVKRERDTNTRKNMLRAAGACGGPSADKDAAKFLLRAITASKQNSNRKHAALSLRHYRSDAGKKLVVKKLERLAAKSNDYGVRGGLVYTLAHIGNAETTLPVFEKILEDVENNRWAKTFMRAAIRKLKGEGDFGRSAWFLFSEDREDPARAD